MRKPHGGIKMMTEYAKHLRSGSKNGHKRNSMSRAYWREWRAKARADLRRRGDAAIEEMLNEEQDRKAGE